MDLALVVALAVTATLLAVSCGLLAVAWAAGRRTRRDLEVSRTEIERLAARIHQLERVPPKRPEVPENGYLITDAGTRAPDEAAEQSRTRVVVSAGLAEPVVKALAFGYGVHRALSPQNRNRIRFEMRREVRRARKQRRRTTRRAQRQATGRAGTARQQAVT